LREQLDGKNAAETNKPTDEPSRQKQQTEAYRLEHGTESSELIYYQRHLEATEQISELRDSVVERQAEIDELRSNLQRRDAEIEQLKASVSSPESSSLGLMAAIQSDLERVTAER